MRHIIRPPCSQLDIGWHSGKLKGSRAEKEGRKSNERGRPPEARSQKEKEISVRPSVLVFSARRSAHSPVGVTPVERRRRVLEQGSNGGELRVSVGRVAKAKAKARARARAKDNGTSAVIVMLDPIHLTSPPSHPTTYNTKPRSRRGQDEENTGDRSSIKQSLSWEAW